ncbi:response regulator [Anaeromyxobacter sp. Fw109-5]|uniref:response regulator n=1 Tax=Anaeromyxobacter sp. (strain Fw109-5) TaxID=404589 RepID=UPI0000ED6EBE|nr:response regulator [Anaeromyxobacter sp. Fw109-5]ABS28539.1 response regulator receiver modulated PilZ sensor protein [Anaeromyxobacter sp. Fw109-5]
MSTADHLCIFERATGERLLAAERFVLALPQLLGAALDGCDLGLDGASRRLLVLLRLSRAPVPPGARERLAFWAARAGGRACDIGQVPPADLAELRGVLGRCEPRLADAAGAELYLASAAFFTDAGAPALRRRSPGERPQLVLDLAGAAAAGASYEPGGGALFVPSPMAPPEGDELRLVVRVAGAAGVLEGRAQVTSVRRPAEATPGAPAGYTLSVQPEPPALRAALAAHVPAPAPPASDFTRAAPRLDLHSPAKVLGRIALERAQAPAAVACATIAYESSAELEQDFVENLSQGGAFVRTQAPAAVGTPVALALRLPDGGDLHTRATVAYVSDEGMGVRFQLAPEEEARLYAAIVQLTARPRRALVVDDDALHRRMLGDALRDRGFEVVTAADGAEGLRALADELLTLDLLLTDLCMPGMDGEAFVRTIRHAGGETELAVVVVTGQSGPELAPRLLAAGADEVLEKALGAERVAEAADGVVERRRLTRTGASP